MMNTYAVTVFGTIALIPLATVAWLLTIKEVDRPEHWDNAALTGGICVAVVFAPITLRRIALDGLTVSLRWFLSWTLAGIALGWVSQLALEDTLVERPDGVGEFPDRYPEWFQRGLDG